MRRIYANPPLLEVVCEFKFPAESNWDITIPGLLYEALKNEFPIKKKDTIGELVIQKLPNGQFQQIINSRERISFRTVDEKTTVNVAPFTLSIHQFKPYSRWEDFKHCIDNAFNALEKSMTITSFERIGLRYVNSITISPAKVDLEEFFNFRPFIGPALPQELKELNNFTTNCAVQYEGGKNICNLRLATQASPLPNNASFILDIDYFLNQPKTINVADVDNWLNKAHATCNILFEGCTTDKLKALFDEKANALH